MEQTSTLYARVTAPLAKAFAILALAAASSGCAGLQGVVDAQAHDSSMYRPQAIVDLAAEQAELTRQIDEDMRRE